VGVIESARDDGTSKALDAGDLDFLGMHTKSRSLSASRARQTAAGKKKRGTAFGMTWKFRCPALCDWSLQIQKQRSRRDAGATKTGRRKPRRMQRGDPPAPAACARDCGTARAPKQASACESGGKPPHSKMSFGTRRYCCLRTWRCCGRGTSAAKAARTFRRLCRG
jgi:hypothetical protein